MMAPGEERQSAIPGTPDDGCGEVNPNFQHVVGLSVGRGFCKALRDTCHPYRSDGPVMQRRTARP